MMDNNSLEKLFAPKFDFIREIFFNVIKEQEGTKFFNLFQQVETTAKKCRVSNETNPFLCLKKCIDKLSNKEKMLVIRGLTIYFELSNLLEDQYRVDVVNLKSRDSKAVELTNLKNIVCFAKKKKLSLSSLLKLISSIQCCLVWTAHPTDTSRLSRIDKFKEIIKDLSSVTFLDSCSSTNKLEARIKRQITLLWQSSELRYNPIHVIDEVRRSLYYIDQTLMDVVPKLMQDLRCFICDIYKVPIKKVVFSPFITFNLWPGGDRDGNPHVSAAITKYSICLLRRMLCRQYLSSIKDCLKELSCSSERVKITKALNRSIESDKKRFPTFNKGTIKLNQYEPYRKKCDFMRLKLENTLQKLDQYADNIGLGATMVGRSDIDPHVKIGPSYISFDEFLKECYLIKDSLEQNKGECIAPGALQTLIDKVEIFEKCYLDIRQHSSVHKDALIECLSYLDEDVSSDFLISAHLVRELTSSRLLGVKSFIDKLSPGVQDVLRTIQVALEPEKSMSKQTVRSYIISMTSRKDDLLTVLLFFKEMGLLTVKKGLVTEAKCDVVPLFETKADLEKACEIIEALFEDSFYRSYLKKRENIQEIMLGYSDSNKDVGSLASQLELMIVQEKILDLAKKYRVKCRFFHGRGGTISRGGGPMNRSLQTFPIDSMSDLKITEQGEMIPVHYTNPNLAYRHLEQIIHAVLIRNIKRRSSKKTEVQMSSKQQFICSELNRVSQLTYENLIKNNGQFKDFFHTVTPIDLIEVSLIGSRPAKRTMERGPNEGITTMYRAIPWVFSWMQTRLLISGFYGVGTALAFIEQQYGIGVLCDLFERWPFFNAYIQNLQMVLVKADMKIAKEYLALSDFNPAMIDIFKLIMSEHQNTTEYVLQLTNQDELMENAPKIKERILRRNPFVDPLNLIQIDCLKRWRSRGRFSDQTSQQLQRQLLQTVNGITAGIRNYA